MTVVMYVIRIGLSILGIPMVIWDRIEKRLKK